MATTRRSFLALAPVLWRQALRAAQQHAHAAGPAAPATAYKLSFFTEQEAGVVWALADRIVPADERSGGARAARVEEYIDFILDHAAPELQKAWREGLERIGPAIAKQSAAQIDAVLARLAAQEFAPTTPDEEFFVLLKGAVVEGFYTSEEGIRKELGYAGNSYVREFPGCRHEAHSKPAGYQPLLRSKG